MDKARTRLTAFNAKVVAGAKRLAKFTKSLVAVVAVAGGVLAALTAIGKKIFDVTAGLIEIQSKFDTVFGPKGAKTVSEFLDTFAGSVGLTVSEGQALVAVTAQIAQGMGMAQAKSAGFAIDVAKLAGDMGSFNNLPTEEVIRAINSALTGEREALKRMAIDIKEAEVQKLAFAQTSKKVAANLTQEEKALATLTLIQRKAGVAVGDVARTYDSLANRAKRIKAIFGELKNTIAKALTPAFEHILGVIEADALKHFGSLMETIKENSAAISQFGIAIFEWGKLAALVLASPFRIVFNLFQMVLNLTQAVTSLIRLDWDGLKASVTNVFKNFEEGLFGVSDVLDQLGPVVGETYKMLTGDFVETEAQAVKLQNSVQELSNAQQDAQNSIADTAARATQRVETLLMKVDAMANNFANNFINRMITAAQGGQSAFEGFFQYMRNQLIALSLRFAMNKTLSGMFPNSEFIAGITNKPTAATLSNSGAKNPDGTSIMHPLGGLLPQVGGGGGGGGRGGTTVVNQTVSLNVSAMDGRDAARFLQENKGVIADVVAQATRDSTGYRAQLIGGGV
tara:strand:+ start:3219 stop:4919 length:1701 start_codon:yes stop_codon:yes gene_type:complete